MKRPLLTFYLILLSSLGAFAQNAEDACSGINIVSPALISKGEEAVLGVRTSTDLGKRAVEYNWSVKGGRILEGQNTKSIKILRENDELTVAVEARVLPEQCTMSATEMDVLDPSPLVVIDVYGKVSPAVEKAKTNEFLIELEKNPDDRGVIILEHDGKLIRRLGLLLEQIRQRKFDRSRITFLISGTADRGSTEMSRMPPGAEMPDCGGCTLVTAEEYDNNKTFFDQKLTVIR